jgi:hypothetical protein
MISEVEVVSSKIAKTDLNSKGKENEKVSTCPKKSKKDDEKDDDEDEDMEEEVVETSKKKKAHPENRYPVLIYLYIINLSLGEEKQSTYAHFVSVGMSMADGHPSGIA